MAVDVAALFQSQEQIGPLLKELDPDRSGADKNAASPRRFRKGL